MQIEDRPITDFELECICKSQLELKDQPIYAGMKKQKDDYIEMLKGISEYGELESHINNLLQISHQIGFFDGQAFQAKKVEELQKRINPE